MTKGQRKKNVQCEGYRLAYRIAADNLQNGISVVADSVNPWQLTRDEWEDVAISNKAHFVNIEVICSDIEEHKKRAENREPKISGLKLPTWQQIIGRDYQAWHKNRFVIDTAGKTIEAAFENLLNLLRQKKQ